MFLRNTMLFFVIFFTLICSSSSWPSFTFHNFKVRFKIWYLYNALVPRILRLVSLKYLRSYDFFLVSIYCLMFGKILEYMSLTIFFQSSLYNTPFRIWLIQELLFRWAKCGPWASCFTKFSKLNLFAVCFTYDSVEDIREIAKILKKSLIIGIYLLKKRPLKKSL